MGFSVLKMPFNVTVRGMGRSIWFFISLQDFFFQMEH